MEVQLSKRAESFQYKHPRPNSGLSHTTAWCGGLYQIHQISSRFYDLHTFMCHSAVLFNESFMINKKFISIALTPSQFILKSIGVVHEIQAEFLCKSELNATI